MTRTIQARERERLDKYILDEIAAHRAKYENAQVRYGYGSKSAERTMEKHDVLACALTSYLESKDGKASCYEKLFAVEDTIKRAEKQIELYGATSMPVRALIGDVKRIIYGGGGHD